MKKWACSIVGMSLTGIVAAAPVPALQLDVNVSDWMAYYANAAETNDTSAKLQALGITRLSVVVLTENEQVHAVARIETAFPNAREAWLSQTNLVQLEAVSEHEFKWIPDQKKSASINNPMEQLHIRFSENAVLMADSDHFSDAEKLDSDAAERYLAKGSIHLAALLDPLLTAAETKVAEQEEGFGKSMMTGVLKSVTGYMTAIREVSAVSVEITATSLDRRVMELGLQYADISAAQKAKSFFEDSADAWKNPAISEKLLNLASLIDTENFRGFSLDANTLRFSYEWPAMADKEMMQLIAQAVFGSLISFGDSDDYPTLSEQIIDPPHLVTSSDFDETRFAEQFRSALFSGHTWSHQVDLEVDYLELPNVDFLEAALTNVSVIATNGIEISNDDRSGQFRYDSSKRNAAISLPTEQDGPTAQTASFTIEFNLATEVEVHSLSKATPLLEKDDGGIYLLAISNSVIRLRSKGMPLSEAKIYARNQEGQYISRQGASWSASHYRGTYKGIPHTVEVVIPVKSQSFSLDIKDLAVGEADQLEMPSSPTNTVVTRYTMESPETFLDPDMSLIAAGEISYVTNASWQKNKHQLQFPKPENVEVEKGAMTIYLAGVDEFVVLSGKRGWASSGHNFYWNLENTNVLMQATGIFGELNGTLWSGIGNYSTDVSINSVPLIPGQELPAVSVEHNVVWIEPAPNGKAMDVQAFDATGRRLKRDNRTSSKNSMRGYFFWGRPSRTTITYASSKQDLVVPFEIELKEGGLKAISAMEENIAAFEEMLDIVKEMDKKSSARYGNLLAANYYFCQPNKKPKAAIPLEIAQSDPIGAPIFGYEATPYKGYFFRKILDQSDVEKGYKTDSHTWAEGTFEAPVTKGILLATPANKKGPGFLVRWGNVYVNFNDCSDLTQISLKPDDLKAAGWIAVQ
jgi:hypothetical protein